MAQRGRFAGRQPGRPAPVRPVSKVLPVPVDVAAIREVVEVAVAGAGYELESLAIKPVGRRWLLRVIIDGDDGLGLDVIAEVAREVSQVLDEAEASGRDLIPGEYQLEVSSPGVDRPLTTPAHWRRNLGRLVKVKAGTTSLTGRVTAANEQTVTLEVAGIAHLVSYADLGPGRVQIEFSRLDEVADEELAEFEDEEER